MFRLCDRNDITTHCSIHFSVNFVVGLFSNLALEGNRFNHQPGRSVFSEFAIVTSFIGFVYGLLDFFKDALDVSPNDDSKRLPLYSLVFLPSTSLSVLNPSIFFSALDYVGTFSISILGGIIPAAMAWKQRYSQQQNSNPVIKPLIPGGKVTLIALIGVSLAVMVKQVILMQ